MLKTLHIGLGTIGREIVKATLTSGKGTPVAGVDPAFAGKTLSDLPQVPPGQTAPIYGTLKEALGHKPDIAVLSTASTVDGIADDLRALIAAGVNVVSTCEKLAYPWLEAAELAAQLDEAAKEAAVTIVGTGVNPGFVLDLFAVTLTRPCETVQSVRAVRKVNTARRRQQLQVKTGAGMTIADFEAKARAGQIGHVGLSESAALIAKGLGWPVDRDLIRETLEPIVAEGNTQSDHVKVAAGRVKGQYQTVTLPGPAGRSIELALTMELGCAEEYDEVTVTGEPSVQARIIGGVFGDSATAGCTVNIMHQVVHARPGLLTVLDLPAV
jgi:2,4-diaminopentanoate dehydrogenase